MRLTAREGTGRIVFRPAAMWRCRLAVVVGLLTALGSLPAVAYPRPGSIQRIGPGGSDDRYKGNALRSVIGADGRYIVFVSHSADLVPNDTNLQPDVFLSDRLAGVVERISVGAGGEAKGPSHSPAMTPDGRFVAFVSLAQNLVPGDTNGANDVFVRDRATGKTERVSLSSDGAEADAESGGSFPNWDTVLVKASPSISADGRYVAFVSLATNLAPGDANGHRDVFVRDRVKGTTERVSVGQGALDVPGGDGSFSASLSADGRYVAFVSSLSLGDFSSDPPYPARLEVFVRDRSAETTERVSVGQGGLEPSDVSDFPSISADGRYVAFASLSANLVPGDTNSDWDVFVRDRVSRTTERVSVGSNGQQAGGGYATFGGGYTTISADGRYVAFASGYASLGLNSSQNIFVHDRMTGATEPVSVVPGTGVAGNGPSVQPSISPEGRYVVFTSSANGFDVGDAYGWYVFVRDRGADLGVVTEGLLFRTGAGGLRVQGQATLTGAVISQASDEPSDGKIGGFLGAEGAGAEIVLVGIVRRPENEDVLIRFRMASLPPLVAGAPAILYGLSFESAGVKYEVRALRASATSVPPGVPYFALYRCTPSCAEQTLLPGWFGPRDVAVSVAPNLIGPPTGTELSNVLAFTAFGEAISGSLSSVDEVALPNAMISVPRVQLGLAASSVPKESVAFTVSVPLSAGGFDGTLSTSGKPAGAYRAWVRACIGLSCGEPVSKAVTL